MTNFEKHAFCGEIAWRGRVAVSTLTRIGMWPTKRVVTATKNSCKTRG